MIFRDARYLRKKGVDAGLRRHDERGVVGQTATQQSL
jgi:hypothetical protein